MPENNSPAAKPEPEASPGEFDFAQAPAENPRLKRRSLKPAGGAPPAARDLAREAPPLAASEVKPAYQPPQEEDEISESAAQPEPAPARPAIASTAQPTSRTTPTQPASTTSPHGTRPATLYYSSAPRKDKEALLPMKSTPTATPAPSSSTTTLPSSVTRPASTSSSSRPSSVIDYRSNVDRQAREQRSVGGVLSILVYALIGFFVIGAILAGYGAYIVSVQLHQQSATVADLDARYSAANKDLNTRLGATLDTLTLAQAQVNRQQELITKQQETINTLLNSAAANTTALRKEQQVRTEETASLRARLKDLEYRGPSTQKY